MCIKWNWTDEPQGPDGGGPGREEKDHQAQSLQPSPYNPRKDPYVIAKRIRGAGAEKRKTKVDAVAQTSRGRE